MIWIMSCGDSNSQKKDKEEPEDKQKKADKSFSHWFDEQVKNCGCLCNG